MSDCPRGKVAATAVLTVGALACLALNLPGQMSYDSVLQLSQGRAGIYNAWHPPFMAWMLGVLDALVRGTALFVVLQTVLVFASLISFVWMGRGRGWPLAVVAVVCSLTPQLLNYPGIVWKDVLFAAASLTGFASLAYAEVRWRHPWLRRAAVAKALVWLTVAALVRQNGAVTLVFAGAAVAWLVIRHVPRPALLRGLVQGFAFIIIGLAVAAGVNAALDAHTDGEPAQRYQVEDLQAYDIVSALTYRPSLNLEVLHEREPGLERLLRTTGVAVYTPERIDPLADLDIVTVAREANERVIGDQWRALVLRHPLLYLQVRARAFAWVFLTPRIADCVPAYVGVDGPRGLVDRLALHHRILPRDKALEAYVLTLVGTPVYWHGLFAAIAAVLLVVSLARRRAGDIAVAAMLAAALAFAASFFLISVACDYRYLYFLDLSAMAASLYWAGGFRRGTDRDRP
jgi:hypothetical protein